MESIDSAVMLVDGDFRHALAVGELLDRIGHSPRRIRDTPIEEMFPRHAETLRHCYEDAFAGETGTAELDYCGHELYVQAEPVRDADGNVVAAMGVFFDASEWQWCADVCETIEQWSHELLETETESELFGTIIDTATGGLPFSDVTVYRFDESAVTLRPVATSMDIELDAVSPGDNLVWETFKRDATVFRDEVPSGAETTVSTPEAYRFAVPFGEDSVIATGVTDGTISDDRIARAAEILGGVADTALARIRCRAQLQSYDRELRQRTRKLERTQRAVETFRDIVRAAISAESLDALDEAVCDLLARDDATEFVWIGELDRADGRISPRSWSGAEKGCIEQVSTTLEKSDWPTVRTALRREPIVVDDIASEVGDQRWPPEALERGFRSVMTVPLSHDGITHGVLTLYADQPNAFDELAGIASDLGNVIGYAITAIQCRNALVAHRSTELEMEITAPACFFVRFVRETGTSVTFEAMTPADDGSTLAFVTAEAPERLLEQARETAMVDSARRLDADTGDGVIEVSFEESFIGSFLSTYGITLESVSATPEEVRITVSLPPTMTPRRALDIVESEYPDSTLLAKREGRRGDRDSVGNHPTVFDTLTERQYEVLERAYEAGYFETPKEMSGSALAESMDISTSAFHDRLRAAERALFSWLFEEDSE